MMVKYEARMRAVNGLDRLSLVLRLLFMGTVRPPVG